MLFDRLQLVRAEFTEIPGLQLTLPQIQRLCGLDDGQSSIVVAALIESRFLQLRSDGRYVRADIHESAPPRIRAARHRWA
jgi:hypothetical protein